MLCLLLLSTTNCQNNQSHVSDSNSNSYAVQQNDVVQQMSQQPFKDIGFNPDLKLF